MACTCATRRATCQIHHVLPTESPGLWSNAVLDLRHKQSGWDLTQHLKDEEEAEEEKKKKKEDEHEDEDEIAGEDEDERRGKGRIQMKMQVMMVWC